MYVDTLKLYAMNKYFVGFLMHRSIAGYNHYNLFILTKDYSKNFTTNKVLTIGHMSVFVVKCIVIQINGLALDLSILGSPYP